jgi:hypothetical protein
MAIFGLERKYYPAYSNQITAAEFFCKTGRVIPGQGGEIDQQAARNALRFYEFKSYTRRLRHTLRSFII